MNYTEYDVCFIMEVRYTGIEKIEIGLRYTVAFLSQHIFL